MSMPDHLQRLACAPVGAAHAPRSAFSPASAHVGAAHAPRSPAIAPPAAAPRPVPDFLRRTQAPARFAAWDDGCLEIRVGEEVLVLMPEDLRRLADFTRRWEGEAP